MKDSTLSKLGGICSILLGVSYLVIGITIYYCQQSRRQGVLLRNFCHPLRKTQRPSRSNTGYSP